MSRSVALPRSRARRRKPKPPWWRWRLALLIFKLSFAVYVVLHTVRDPRPGSVLVLAAWLWFVADDWRDVARWWGEEDVPITPPSLRQINWAQIAFAAFAVGVDVGTP